jgi:cyclophilin family peptidyl-prolyl cis-trans isomerase
MDWPKTLRRTRRQTPGNPLLLERLEERVVLYQNPMVINLPVPSMLERWQDSVVRVHTNLGSIDIELFENVAPITVANFKKYITSGRLDETFFHRLIPGSVLQGGGFRFSDTTGLSSVTADPPIANEFSRPNLARTVAMAKVAGNPNSATSQFFFNLVDNPAFNTQNGGYTVFGKVVQGWNIVTTIAALTRRDLDLQFTGSNPNPGVFDDVPTTPQYNPSVGPREATLVKVLDIELVKAANVNKFYEQSYTYPEGFRSATVTERLDIVNLESANAAYYQVIVRYENGDRDQVIDFGSIGPNGRRSIKIVDAANPSLSKTRPGVGYAIVLRSSRAMGATLDHRDSGVTLQEGLVMEGRQATGWLQRWTFGGGEKGTLYTSYVLVNSLTDQDISVFVTIYPENGAARTFALPTKAFRRSGLAVHTLASSLVPDGAFSFEVTATGPIIAGFSQYKTGGSGNVSDGDSAQGVMFGGSFEGYLAGAYIPSANPNDAKVDLIYTASSPFAIVVDFTFYLTNGTVLQGSPVLLTNANRRDTVKLTDLNASLPLNQFFSVQYRVRNDAARVAVNYRTELAGDSAATPFQVQTGRRMAFGDGYTDPSTPENMREYISIFNPFANTGVTFLYQLFFYFADGTTIIVPSSVASLAAHRRVDLRATDFPAVMTKINSNPAFRFYSVEVVTTAFGGGVPPTIGGVVAQMTRWHTAWGQSMTSLGTPDVRENLFWLDNAAFR